MEPDDLQAFHHMRKKDHIIVKFKCRKQKHHVFLNRKTLQNKSLDLMQLKFSGKLFVNESMCHENHQLAYRCRQLKSAHKIHSTWFYNSTLHIKLVENGPIHKIIYPTVIEKVLEVDNLEEYIGNLSFCLIFCLSFFFSLSYTVLLKKLFFSLPFSLSLFSLELTFT